MKGPISNNQKELSNDLTAIDTELEQLKAHHEKIVGKIEESVDEMQNIQDMVAENRMKLRTVSVVQHEIEQISHLVEKAKESIRSMGADQLNEIICYKNPPDKVKLVLEALTLVMTGNRLN